MFHFLVTFGFLSHHRWSGGAMVLGKLPEPGRPTFWMIKGQGLAVGAEWGCLDIFNLLCLFSPFFSPLFGRRPDVD